LPEGLAPRKEYHLTLFRVQDTEDTEDTEEENLGIMIPTNEEWMVVREGEEFLVYLSDDVEYKVELKGNWWESYDTTRPDYEWFTSARVYVMRYEEEERTILNGTGELMYYNDKRREWYVGDRIEREEMGRHAREETITIPADESPSRSIGSLARMMLGRIPGLTQRVREHLLEEWREGWRRLYMDTLEEYPEEEGEYPVYAEDYPEEPQGIQRYE
jgi:hypothetical protein